MKEIQSMSDDSGQTTLNGQFLVSMPDLKDGVFDSALVLMCEHGESGAMGFIVGAQLFHEIEYITPIAIYALIQYVALMFYIGNININKITAK